MKNKIKVETKDTEGKDLVLFVRRPDPKIYRQSQLVSSKAFAKALSEGAMLRVQVEKYVRERGIWDDAKQKELLDVDTKILDGLSKLKAGGIKLSEARQIALDIRLGRLMRVALLSERNQLDQYTVESRAEDERFDFFVSECVFDEEGNKVFANLEDYQSKSTEDYAVDTARALSRLIYELDDDWEKKLPENQFLMKYHFMNDKLQLVDKDGHLVDFDFNKLDEENEEEMSDVEPTPFLDDDGNPIVE